ncbi:MAG: hypothetical protein K5989_12255 [Lachnospiraceae bacterium]|nr:hypothetical protein [Lachnospiraceae bacterium]
MFINLSNHPSEKWDEKQRKAAEEYGNIMDIKFPAVESHGDERYILDLAKEFVESIMEYANEELAVMVQGEFTLTFAIVSELKERGIRVVSACSERNVHNEVNSEGEEVKVTRFEFVRFREYVQ